MTFAVASMEGQAIGDFYAWHGLPFSQLASGQRATELNSSSSRVVCPHNAVSRRSLTPVCPRSARARTSAAQGDCKGSAYKLCRRAQR